ncbi:MAG: flagellar motor protein MotB [Planctomycetota bacterium]
MARKHKHEEHENHERWLVSYADFITLLFAFFVVLYSISQVDLKKLSQAKKSFGNSFRGSSELTAETDPSQHVDPDSWRYAPIFPNVVNEAAEDEKDYQDMREVKRRLQAILESDGLTEGVKLGVENRGLVVHVEADVLFGKRSVKIAPQGRRLLDRLGAVLRTLRGPVMLNAESNPREANLLASAFERNAARAAAVGRYFAKQHRLPPEFLFYGAQGEVPRGKTAKDSEALEVVIVRKGLAQKMLR